jgi:hypothetical protein
LNNAGAGVSRVYGYSHDANNAPSVGDNINVLNASRCGSVSTNFISITRQAADGGRIISDQGDIITICLDNEPDQVLFTPILLQLVWIIPLSLPMRITIF